MCNTHANTYGIVDSNSYSNSYSDRTAAAFTDATATTDTAASSLALFRLRGTRENELASSQPEVDRPAAAGGRWKVVGDPWSVVAGIDDPGRRQLGAETATLDRSASHPPSRQLRRGKQRSSYSAARCRAKPVYYFFKFIKNSIDTFSALRLKALLH